MQRWKAAALVSVFCSSVLSIWMCRDGLLLSHRLGPALAPLHRPPRTLDARIARLAQCKPSLLPGVAYPPYWGSRNGGISCSAAQATEAYFRWGGGRVQIPPNDMAGVAGGGCLRGAGVSRLASGTGSTSAPRRAPLQAAKSSGHWVPETRVGPPKASAPGPGGKAPIVEFQTPGRVSVHRRVPACPASWPSPTGGREWSLIPQSPSVPGPGETSGWGWGAGADFISLCSSPRITL